MAFNKESGGRADLEKGQRRAWGENIGAAFPAPHRGTGAAAGILSMLASGVL